MGVEEGFTQRDFDAFSSVDELLHSETSESWVDYCKRNVEKGERTALQYATIEAQVGNVDVAAGYLLCAEGSDDQERVRILASAILKYADFSDSIANPGLGDEGFRMHSERAKKLRQSHKALLQWFQRRREKDQLSGVDDDRSLPD
jgi:hypothetical protein